VKLRYTQPDNFIDHPVYQCVGLDRAYLHQDCVAKIQKAAEELLEIDKNKYLIVLDAFRPNFAQQKMRAWAEQVHPVDADSWVGKAYNPGIRPKTKEKSACTCAASRST